MQWQSSRGESLFVFDYNFVNFSVVLSLRSSAVSVETVVTESDFLWHSCCAAYHWPTTVVVAHDV